MGYVNFLGCIQELEGSFYFVCEGWISLEKWMKYDEISLP